MLFQTLGCDWVIDSEAKEDPCGVCHGDGSTCKTVKTEFKEVNGQGMFVSCLSRFILIYRILY